MRRPCASTGLTLIELLTAMALFSLLLGAVYGTFRMVRSSADRVDGLAEANQLGRAVLEQLETDLANLYPLWMRPTEESEELADLPPEAEGASTALGERLAFLHEDNQDANDSLDLDLLSFVSATLDPADDRRVCSDLAEVTYYVEGEEGAPQQGLIRTVNHLPGAAAEPVEPTVEQVCEEVVSLNFRFWDPSQGDWLETWESDSELPPLIEVTLGFAREGDPPRLVQAVLQPRSTGLPEELLGHAAPEPMLPADAEEEAPVEPSPPAPPGPPRPSLPGSSTPSPPTPR